MNKFLFYEVHYIQLITEYINSKQLMLIAAELNRECIFLSECITVEL